MAAQRRLGPWIVGLFVIAQIFGVVPLISEHTAHLAEVQLVLSKESASTGSIPQGPPSPLVMPMVPSSTMNCRI